VHNVFYSLHFFQKMHYLAPRILIAVSVSAIAVIAAIAEPGKMAPYPGDFMPHPIVQPNPNDSPKAELDWWFNFVRNKISKNWTTDFSKLPPNCCSCTFTLGTDGKLSNVKLITSSGSAKIDQSFLKAIEKASPVPKEKFALHRTILVKSASAQDYQLHCV
jgi:hypothetical protein